MHLFCKVFVLCTTFICITYAQGNEGTPCSTPDNQYGMCVSVYSCKIVKDILSSNSITEEKRKFVRSLSCGYSRNTPLVCCPQATTRENVNPGAIVDVVESEEINNDSGVFLRSPECGVSNVTFPRVVGGVPAKLGEFPWVVSLGYKNSKNPMQPKWLCGGTLITKKHVITAGHCVHNRNDLYLARLAELDLFDDNDGAHPVDIPLASAKIHENYSPTKFTSDIAILTLSRNVDGIPLVLPICLPWETQLRSNTFLNNQPLVAGWGALYFNGPSSSILQLATIPVVANERCERAYVNKSVIDDRIICAGYENGAKDACQGDSGGPLMLGRVNPNEKDIRFYLIGIVSYGFRCAEAGYPGVYTRVTKFLGWIQQNIV